MKKKINRMLVAIASLAIMFTMLLITVVYYDLLKRQVMEDLRAHAALYAARESDEMVSEQYEQRGIRITVIDRNGKVIFDNEVDYQSLENHGQRPEIQDAFSDGEGWIVRRSETLDKSTFYYAVLMEEGVVLRVAKDAGSIYSIFARVLPSLFFILALLVAVSAVLARFLTRKLIRPVEQLAANLDAHNDKTDYEELAPFISMIRSQHQDIVKNAKMRQEFTANVSHELKTPLTSISGYAELIETGIASEEDVQRFAKGIRKNANRLLTLINDTIRLSELDSSEDEIVTESLDLYELAASCVDMLTVNAEKLGVDLHLQGETCYVKGNRQMLEEVLYNLCDNAIRYNNAGGSVEVSVYPEGDTQSPVILRVKDTGIGIPKEHQERIFERFYRVDKSRSKSTGGTGLGLAIVKHILARHNARIEIVSEAGRGTEVTVTFLAL